MPEHDRPIAIVGGGIGGLALAAALHHAGRPVVVLEARDHLDIDDTAGAGISLWPNALAALDDIGLGGRVRESGGAVASGGIRQPDGTWLRRLDRARSEAALGEPLVAVHRAALLRALASAIDPASLRLGKAVRCCELSPSGVTVISDDGERMPARAAVGADGTRSVIARALNPNLYPRYAGYTAWRAVAEIGIHDVEPSETWGPRGEFGFVPLGPDRTYWFATERGPEGADAAEGELAHLARVLASWHDPIPRLLRATNSTSVLRHDMYDRATARRWTAGPVTLIGDAAHPMRPHLGQGGCQALVDAAVLARLLVTQRDIGTAFARLPTLRRRQVRQVVWESAVIGRAIHCPPPLGPALHRVASVPPESVLVAHVAGIAGRAAFHSAVHGS